MLARTKSELLHAAAPSTVIVSLDIVIAINADKDLISDI